MVFSRNTCRSSKLACEFYPTPDINPNGRRLQAPFFLVDFVPEGCKIYLEKLWQVARKSFVKNSVGSSKIIQPKTQPTLTQLRFFSTKSTFKKAVFFSFCLFSFSFCNALNDYYSYVYQWYEPLFRNISSNKSSHDFLVNACLSFGGKVTDFSRLVPQDCDDCMNIAIYCDLCESEAFKNAYEQYKRDCCAYGSGFEEIQFVCSRPNNFTLMSIPNLSTSCSSDYRFKCYTLADSAEALMRDEFENDFHKKDLGFVYDTINFIHDTTNILYFDRAFDSVIIQIDSTTFDTISTSDMLKWFYGSGKYKGLDFQTTLMQCIFDTTGSEFCKNLFMELQQSSMSDTSYAYNSSFHEEAYYNCIEVNGNRFCGHDYSDYFILLVKAAYNQVVFFHKQLDNVIAGSLADFTPFHKISEGLARYSNHLRFLDTHNIYLVDDTLKYHSKIKALLDTLQNISIMEQSFLQSLTSNQLYTKDSSLNELKKSTNKFSGLGFVIDSITNVKIDTLRPLLNNLNVRLHSIDSVYNAFQKMKADKSSDTIFVEMYVDTIFKEFLYNGLDSILFRLPNNRDTSLYVSVDTTFNSRKLSKLNDLNQLLKKYENKKDSILLNIHNDSGFHNQVLSKFDTINNLFSKQNKQDTINIPVDSSFNNSLLDKLDNVVDKFSFRGVLDSIFNLFSSESDTNKFSQDSILSLISDTTQIQWSSDTLGDSVSFYKKSFNSLDSSFVNSAYNCSGKNCDNSGAKMYKNSVNSLQSDYKNFLDTMSEEYSKLTFNSWAKKMIAPLGVSSGSNSCPAFMYTTHNVSFGFVKIDFSNIFEYLCAPIFFNYTLWQILRTCLRCVVSLACMLWLFKIAMGVYISVERNPNDYSDENFDNGDNDEENNV